MKKIPSLFARNHSTDRQVRDEVLPESEWVARGEGHATRKWDGTCCLVRDGALWKRRELKRGKTPPAGFDPATEVDPNTGKQQGWVPVGDGPEDAWFREAFSDQADGTYELCGPKIQGNPEGLEVHALIPHGRAILEDAPRTFDALKVWLADKNIEGIVWHHPDGRMVKIKKRDFGL